MDEIGRHEDRGHEQKGRDEDAEEDGQLAQ
jgi:hypothetical protein